MQLLLILGFILVTISVMAYHRVSGKSWVLGMGALLALCQFTEHLSAGILFWAMWGAFAALVFVDDLRWALITRPVKRLFKSVLPPMSDTEREAIEAGDVWLEGDFFRGAPDWTKVLALPKPKLSNDEQNFIDNEVETLCEMIDEWTMTHVDRAVPDKIWSYLKDNRFFGMIIPKSYGGLGFTALGHSTVITKISTRSGSIAVSAMVPNSLGPAELLLKYGTQEQKDYYLPRLAKGQEIPCFALTSPVAGSDAASIPDVGVVGYGEHNGQKVLGIRLTWDKRYITLAPVATVLGLAFKLSDPEGLLGVKGDLGITLCLVPTNHPGVEIGQYHQPTTMVFPNGPTRGKDVFVPLDWIIGGQAMVGQGWRMLMGCLSEGRGISLPALSTSMGQVSYRTTGAYSKIRKQFNVSIGQFEGIHEALGRIGGRMYRLAAMRVFCTTAIDQHIKPAVLSAIAKYHMTEMARSIIIDAMDVHGGRAIINGPRNYILPAYSSVPISITVEGANILTRCLIVFGQGAIRCHPYIRQSMEAAAKGDDRESMKAFDKSFFGHVAYTMSNKVRALWMGLTQGALSQAPEDAFLKPYIHKLNWMSVNLSFASDMAMLLLGGELKRRESISARLGDVLSHLMLSAAVIKYYVDNGSSEEDRSSVAWCLEDSLYQCQEALVGMTRNLRIPVLGTLIRRLMFPFGYCMVAPSDKLVSQVAVSVQTPSALRDRLTKECYLSKDPTDAIGRMEAALASALLADPIEHRLNLAVKSGTIPKGYSLKDRIESAKKAGLLTPEEESILIKDMAIRFDAISVDESASLRND